MDEYLQRRAITLLEKIADRLGRIARTLERMDNAQDNQGAGEAGPQVGTGDEYLDT